MCCDMNDEDGQMNLVTVLGGEESRDAVLSIISKSVWL